MTVSNVRSWLRRSPHPHKLMADDVEIAIGDGRGKWRDAEMAISELGATKLMAYNADNQLLRICMLEQDDSEPEREDPFKDVKLQSREAEIGKLILEATDRGALRHAEAYNMAFDKMASIVQFSMERATALEAAWQGALNQRAADLDEAGSGVGEDAVTAGIVGMMAQAGAHAPAPKTNGKKTAKK